MTEPPPPTGIPPRVLVVPRWGGTSRDDWYPWFAREVARSEAFGPVVVADMPDPDEPRIEAWVEHLARLAGRDAESLARTLFVGHSVGCRAVLHLLARLPAGTRVRGVLCVAGWWRVDEPWESIRPWIDVPLDLECARAAGGTIRVLLSDNDPFTADAAANARLWRRRLGATVEIVPGAYHFNGREEPWVLEALQRWFGGGERVPPS